MKKQSAGLLLYRKTAESVEVLLVHPGGPFWAKKDHGAWSIPKGEFTEDEDVLHAARREFAEELGRPAPDGEPLDLGSFKRSDGKTIYAFALEADFDASNIQSNTFEMEWPPKSGQTQSFPEVDKAAWVDITKAIPKMHKNQAEFIDRLAEKLHLDLAETKNSTDDQTQTSLF